MDCEPDNPKKPQAQAPGSECVEANTPDQPAPPAPLRPSWSNSRLARRSLKLGVASILGGGLLFLSKYAIPPNDIGADFGFAMLGLLFMFLLFGLMLTAFCYGLAALVQKLVALPLRRETPSLWPALVGMMPLLFLAFWPNLEQMTVYLKTGIWLPRRIFFGRTEVEANFKNIVPKLEARYKKDGAYYPWAPWSARRNQFEALKTLPPEIASLPTFAFSDEAFKSRSDLNLHPSQFGDPFARPVARLAHAYYTTTTQSGGAAAAGYIIWSCGPDGRYDLNAGNIKRAYHPAEKVPSDLLVGLTYDPSNGAASGGDIVRFKKPDGEPHD